MAGSRRFLRMMVLPALHKRSRMLPLCMWLAVGLTGAAISVGWIQDGVDGPLRVFWLASLASYVLSVTVWLLWRRSENSAAITRLDDGAGDESVETPLLPAWHLLWPTPFALVAAFLVSGAFLSDATAVRIAAAVAGALITLVGVFLVIILEDWPSTRIPSLVRRLTTFTVGLPLLFASLGGLALAAVALPATLSGYGVAIPTATAWSMTVTTSFVAAILFATTAGLIMRARRISTTGQSITHSSTPDSPTPARAIWKDPWSRQIAYGAALVGYSLFISGIWLLLGGGRGVVDGASSGPPGTTWIILFAIGFLLGGVVFPLLNTYRRDAAAPAPSIAADAKSNPSTFAGNSSQLFSAPVPDPAPEPADRSRKSAPFFVVGMILFMGTFLAGQIGQDRIPGAAYIALFALGFGFLLVGAGMDRGWLKTPREADRYGMSPQKKAVLLSVFLVGGAMVAGYGLWNMADGDLSSFTPLGQAGESSIVMGLGVVWRTLDSGQFTLVTAPDAMDRGQATSDAIPIPPDAQQLNISINWQIGLLDLHGPDRYVIEIEDVEGWHVVEEPVPAENNVLTFDTDGAVAWRVTVEIAAPRLQESRFDVAYELGWWDSRSCSYRNGDLTEDSHSDCPSAP